MGRFLAAFLAVFGLFLCDCRVPDKAEARAVEPTKYYRVTVDGQVFDAAGDVETSPFVSNPWMSVEFYKTDGGYVRAYSQRHIVIEGVVAPELGTMVVEGAVTVGSTSATTSKFDVAK